MQLGDLIDLIDKPFSTGNVEITVIGHVYDNDQMLAQYVKKERGGAGPQVCYATIPNFERMYLGGQHVARPE